MVFTAYLRSCIYQRSGSDVHSKSLKCGDFLTKQHTQLITTMHYLILDAVITCEICGVELENQELEDSPIGSHGLNCDRTIQNRLGLSLTHTQSVIGGMKNKRLSVDQQVVSVYVHRSTVLNDTLLNMILYVLTPYSFCARASAFPNVNMSILVLNCSGRSLQRASAPSRK